jgi:formylglycine-generating enzyme required for sulfatase activity
MLEPMILVLALLAATEGPAAPPVSSEIRYARVPAGRFQMGCVPRDTVCEPGEKPRHAVTITRDFWMMKTVVTVAAYKKFAEETDRKMPQTPAFNQTWALEDHPIVYVSWDDATAYCAWAKGRLPTEAEWEYAARGGREGLQYPWGDDITHENANFDDPTTRDKWPHTSPVRTYPPNGSGQYDMAGDLFGLYDMAGNVWQWCADWYGDKYYARSTVKDPKGPPSGTQRVLRGGSWYAVPSSLRASRRHHMRPDYGAQDFGFRCVRDTAPPLR